MLKSLPHATKIALFTFLISLAITYSFQSTLSVWLSLIILCIVILTGIIFDVVGTAVTAAEEAPFHAMGSDKVRGSKEAIYLIRHAGQVANFCNDVVGDVAGTISGAISASIILQFIHGNLKINPDFLTASGIAFIAACTVGGKALGKSFAINSANDIIFNVGKIISWFKIIKIDTKKSRRRRLNQKSQKGQKK